MEVHAFVSFMDQLTNLIQQSKLVRLTLSKPRQKSADLRRLTVKPVMLKSGFRYNFLYQYQHRDEARNLTMQESIDAIKELLQTHFLEANLFSPDQHLSYISNAKGNAKITLKEVSEIKTADLSHDRVKQRLINKLAPHWNELGLTNKQGEVHPAMQHKFKQINQYIEILEPMLHAIPAKQLLKIVDMGAGKGYLTFALYEYLSTNTTLDFEITGVELRPELVEKTNAIATRYKYSRLHFKTGSIMDFDEKGTDVLIALHACDTATDDAIAAGIRAQAELIVCAPCCHKQIRNEMSSSRQSFPVLEFGILLERQAEILTDTLRALIMEKYGYRSQIQEFIDAGHTPKNLLLTGIKNPGEVDQHAIEIKIDALKQQFGIRQHYLELALQRIDKHS